MFYTELLESWCCLNSKSSVFLSSALVVTAKVSWHVLHRSWPLTHMRCWPGYYLHSVVNRGFAHRLLLPSWLVFAFVLDYLTLFGRRKPFQAKKAQHHFQLQPRLDLFDAVRRKRLAFLSFWNITTGYPFWKWSYMWYLCLEYINTRY